MPNSEANTVMRLKTATGGLRTQLPAGGSSPACLPGFLVCAWVRWLAGCFAFFASIHGIDSVRAKVFSKPKDLGGDEASAGHTRPHLVTALGVLPLVPSSSISHSQSTVTGNLRKFTRNSRIPFWHHWQQPKQVDGPSWCVSRQRISA